ncbi:hypothetical protein [Tolypothrix sp. VBCCA 56010]|uniref:hypothetical protein n=1 Tax=Tolypothrix sp. VBCCA 56010 TaxID=3137731 RepID=UPI003D7C8018
MEAAFRLLRGLGLASLFTGLSLLVFAYLESRTTLETGPRWAWYEGRDFTPPPSKDPIDRLADKVLKEDGFAKLDRLMMSTPAPLWPATRSFALAGVVCCGLGGLLFGASQRRQIS